MYDITIRTKLGYTETILHVKEELAREGVGILTEINPKD